MMHDAWPLGLPKNGGNTSRGATQPAKPTWRTRNCRCRRRVQPERGSFFFFLFFFLLGGRGGRPSGSPRMTRRLISRNSLSFASSSNSRLLSFTSSFPSKSDARRRKAAVVSSTPSEPSPRNGMARRSTPEHGRTAFGSFRTPGRHPPSLAVGRRSVH